MRTRWISRLVRGSGTRFAASALPGFPVDDGDADVRRLRSDLDAIRVRFADHA